MSKKIKTSLAIILSAALFITSAGCKSITASSSEKSSTANSTSTSESTSSSATEALSGKILITGSTSFLELMGALGEAFSEENPDVTVDVQAGGSGVGISDAINKVNDLGMSSRELKTDGTEEGLNKSVLAIEAIAVIVNAANPVKDLTKDQIIAIFKGEITNWKEVGGADKAITVFNRESSSGTRGAFGELMKLEKTGTDGYNYFTPNAVTQDSTGKVLAGVAADENAIGYIGLGSVDESVHAVSIGGVSPTLVTIKDGTYILKRPFLLLTNKEVENPLVKAFIAFTQSAAGEALVAEMKLIKPSDLN
jgi:phosphate transport system substrate-binding protein